VCKERLKVMSDKPVCVKYTPKRSVFILVLIPLDTTAEWTEADGSAIFCLGFTEQYSNNSDSIRFISSVFYFLLPEDNKEAGRLLAQQGLLSFRAQVYITEREEEARWRRGPNILNGY
jgi:hypothetical protein